MGAIRLFGTALPAALVATSLAGCLLYSDQDDDVELDAPALQPDARPGADARTIDAPTDAPPIPIDAGIDSPTAAPTIEFTAPTDGTLITDHQPVRIDAHVTGNPIAGFDLTVDGVATPAALSASGLPVGGDCYAGCNIIFSWNAAAMREGMHTVQIAARDDVGTSATDSMTFRFEDAPQIIFQRPTGEARGAASVAIQISITDRGPAPIAAALSIDGAQVQSTTYQDCINGCTMTRTWDTSSLAAGTHTLSVTSSDMTGHTTTATQDVIISDIPMITQINVIEDDGIGTLEVEVHLYDSATDQWLGCSGDDFGLANVAYGNTLYNVNAYFVDANRRPLGVDQLAGRQLRIRVTEDDLAECPARPDTSDDEIGDRSGFAAGSLANLSTSFGDVLQLSTRHARPLSR
jgi:hypothetical protein